MLRLKKLFKAVTVVVAVEVQPLAGSVTVKVYVPEVLTALVLEVPPLLQAYVMPLVLEFAVSKTLVIIQVKESWGAMLISGLAMF